ncbi:hypothetical protein [Stenotrophomonas sp.]|uniref:hypothetical protein n=1 Tax=Stenotrophomonas sp. TaxID=69392 RepID=UPI0028AE5A53|nr:hypothetical protein [Stenotrophomonas sp.]
MIRHLLLTALLLAPCVALADEGSPSAAALDLSVPQAPVRYLGDPSVQQDAPGTYYGDHSGRGLPRKGVAADTDSVVDDKLQVHGAVTTGIGYSKAFGNSHYNAVELNLGKNYTTDEGTTRRFDVNIHVSKGDGVGPYGPYGYGPGPWGGW